MSGPGKYSRRTDGKQPVRVAPGGDYGDRAEMEALQKSAPLAEAPKASEARPAQPVDTSSLTPLDAPTGAPGVGLLDNLDQFTGQPAASAIDDQTRERMSAYLPTLLWLASQPSASEQTRQFVRQLRGDL